MTREKKIKVTLMKSLIGRKPKHLATVQALGLRHRHQTIEVIDTPAMRGMLNQVNYLLAIEEN